MPPKTRAPKKAKATKEQSPEFIAVPLSGVLTRLPAETLLDILSHCDPKSVVNFLGSCKALQQLASQNENYVFRKLYHATLALVRRKTYHPLYSPARHTSAKKGEVVRYPASKLLPVAAVYSWKLQWRDLVLWHAQEWSTSSRQHRTLGERCMECGVSDEDVELAEVNELELRLCLLCFAKNLVTNSNISIYRLTERDIMGLQTVEFVTESGFGKVGPKPFYSAHQLTSLAREKHADFDGPKLLKTEKKDASQVRDDLVSTATLLHGGVSWKRYLSTVLYKTGNMGIREDFELEFDHFINAKSFKKGCVVTRIDLFLALRLTRLLPSQASLQEASHRRHPPRLRRFRLEAQGHLPRDRRDHFHPAASPGPATPSDACIDAYTALREAATKEELVLFTSIGNPEAVAQMIKAMQDYVLDPDSHDLTEIVENFRRFKAIKATKESKESMDLRDWTGPVAVDLVAAVSGGGKPQPTATKRLHVLAQVGAILGIPFTTVEARQLDLPAVIASLTSSDSAAHWGAIYYASGVTLDVLKGIYTRSMKERKEALTKIGRRAPTSNHTFMGDVWAEYSLNLSPLYNNHNNLNARQLSFRTKVSRNEYEKEIHRTMSFIHAGAISQSALCAILHKFNCRGFRGRRCLNGDCFIRRASTTSGERDMGSYLSGYDDDGDYYDYSDYF